MTDNVTEADQLIIQLLPALNSTVGDYKASQDSDTSGNVANQLSLTALVVSLIALAVALLQAVLEYASSNSEEGQKCNFGAIGEYATVSGIRKWSWRQWRWKYFYPELKLDFFNVMFQIHDVNNSEVGDLFKELEGLRPAQLENFDCMGDYAWHYDRALETKLPMNTIRNGRCFLARRVEQGWANVLPRDLPRELRLRWFRYLKSHLHRKTITPRATWPQLLTLLNVNFKKMVKNMDTRHLAGADCIPSTLDVPPQKFRLTDLGIFAFCLGFKTVMISAKDRQITATGEIGTITTELLSGFGAVVRLQILSPRPPHFVPASTIPDVAMMYDRGQLFGSFIFPGTDGNRTIRYSFIRSLFADGEPDARCSTIADEAEEWSETAEARPKSQVPEAAEEDTFSNHLRAWRARQDVKFTVGTRTWPTMLLAASVACLPRATTGFPSAVFLCPFLKVFQRMARSFSRPRDAIWDNLDDLEEGTMVLQLLQVDFCRVTGHEYLTGELACRWLSWQYNVCFLRDIESIEKVLLSQMPTYNFYGYFCRHGNPRSQIREDVVAHLEPNETSSSNASKTSDTSRQRPSLFDGRLLPDVVELLEDYDPVSWATSMRSHSRLEYYPGQVNAKRGEIDGWRCHLRPENVLWTQVYLLDLTISKHCQDMDLAAVGKALLKSWEDSKAEAPLINLDKLLAQQLFRGKATEKQLKQSCELADMIRVRTLCYIAYMMVIPDSTSLYRASLEDPVMLPMI